MTQDEMKKKVGLAAIKFIKPGAIIGVGTGSTVAYFIDALGSIKKYLKGAVSSSDSSTKLLKNIGIKILDLNEVDNINIYVDSADEINGNMQMIKGGGGALTNEKIISYVADKFICIVDASKKVDVLGSFPLPIEVIMMARKLISIQLAKLGGFPKYRKNVITNNGNAIIDVHGMRITDPIYLENYINSIPGVVTVGLFANRSADITLIGTKEGIETIKK